MGINTQYYLTEMFARMRAKMIESGQKVEPLMPAAPIKSVQFERKYGADVVLDIRKKIITKEES